MQATINEAATFVMLADDGETEYQMTVELLSEPGRGSTLTVVVGDDEPTVTRVVVVDPSPAGVGATFKGLVEQVLAEQMAGGAVVVTSSMIGELTATTASVRIAVIDGPLPYLVEGKLSPTEEWTWIGACASPVMADHLLEAAYAEITKAVTALGGQSFNRMEH